MVRISLLSLPLVLIQLVIASPSGNNNDKPWRNSRALPSFPETTEYPLPHPGNIVVHDPNILKHNDKFYLFKGGVHIPFYKASNISGPWEKVGTVLDGPSIIQKQNRTRPWAPATIERDGSFYCFYTVSKHGSRNSAIGVATTKDIDEGDWNDHGALITTGKGRLAHRYPYNVSNAIDPAFMTDQKTGKPYLIYGSYWHGIFQIPLADDLLSVENTVRPDARNLAFVPDVRVKPVEGAFMSYREPFYYLWFSRGKCCQFYKGFPDHGKEYNIHVGRSKDIRGPFVDKNGTKLLNGGGTVVYGSNRGIVYAPGGLGVLTGDRNNSDILYYHYLNTTIGFTDSDAHLGWSYLHYEDGWPVAKATGLMDNSSSGIRPNSALNIFIFMCIWTYVWLYG